MAVPQQFPPVYRPQQQPQRRRGLGTGCIVSLAIGGAVVVVFFAFVVIALVAGGSSGKTASAGSSAAAPAAAGMGQVAKDGDFAFTVERESCGRAAARAVGGGGFGEKVPAGAKECIFTLRVGDDKSSAQTFFDGDQYAYDAAGQQFSADSGGGLYLSGDQDGTQVNPGITITARLPFQVPDGDQITSLQLHDSAFSGGVTVQVGS